MVERKVHCRFPQHPHPPTKPTHNPPPQTHLVQVRVDGRDVEPARHPLHEHVRDVAHDGQRGPEHQHGKQERADGVRDEPLGVALEKHTPGLVILGFRIEGGSVLAFSKGERCLSYTNFMKTTVSSQACTTKINAQAQGKPRCAPGLPR